MASSQCNRSLAKVTDKKRFLPHPVALHYVQLHFGESTSIYIMFGKWDNLVRNTLKAPVLDNHIFWLRSLWPIITGKKFAFSLPLQWLLLKLAIHAATDRVL